MGDHHGRAAGGQLELRRHYNVNNYNVPGTPSDQGLNRLNATFPSQGGIDGTARVITMAAAIMVAVFLSFVANSDPTVKMLAVGMAFAVLIDATLVRMILVPTIMTLLGRHAWWMPRWLEPIVPYLQLEGSAAAEASEARGGEVAAGVRPDGDRGGRDHGGRTYSAVGAAGTRAGADGAGMRSGGAKTDQGGAGSSGSGTRDAASPRRRHPR
jgi:MMPL family